MDTILFACFMHYGFATFPNNGASHGAVEMHITENICGDKSPGKNVYIVAPGPTRIEQMELTLWHVFFEISGST